MALASRVVKQRRCAYNPGPSALVHGVVASPDRRAQVWPEIDHLLRRSLASSHALRNSWCATPFAVKLRPAVPSPAPISLSAFTADLFAGADRRIVAGMKR